MGVLKRFNGVGYEVVGVPLDVAMSPQTIGYAEVQSNQSGITADTDINGLSVTVTVPAGRRIRLSTRVYVTSTVATDEAVVRINEGAVQLTEERSIVDAAKLFTPEVIISPSAGTHTYKVILGRFAGSGSLTSNAWSGGPIYLLVEDITGSTLPYQPSSVPVGRLGYAERNDAAPVSIAAGPVDLLSVNVVVPAGRTLKVSAFACTGVGTAGHNEVQILMDGVVLNRSHFGAQAAGQIATHTPSFIISPSAGAHNFVLQSDNAVAGTMYSDAGNETMLLVEDVSPTPAAANTAPSSTLAYVEATTSQGSITTETDLTGLSATISVPAGRRIRITAHAYPNSTVADDTAKLWIKEGSTYLQSGERTLRKTTNADSVDASVILSPSAGTHTYKLSMLRQSGSGTITNNASTDSPSYILIEDITGGTLPQFSGAGLPSSTLGYAQITANQAGITSEVDVAGLSVTVTVPANRRIKITAYSGSVGSTVANDVARLSIKEGSTLMQLAQETCRGSFDPSILAEWIGIPSAGTHTYKVTAARLTGTGTITVGADAQYPAFILVEDITGVGIPGHTHHQLMEDTGWITPSFENGWINYDAAAYQPARYRKVGNIVYISGLVKNGTPNQTIFTLPVGFRPLRNLHFATAAGAAFAILEIKGENGSPAGAVHHNTGATSWYSIECSFMVG